MTNFARILKEVKNTSYITDIPIEEFESIVELESFVKHMEREGIGVVLHYEMSNFHNGVVAQVYDNKACTVKEYLGIADMRKKVE